MVPQPLTRTRRSGRGQRRRSRRAPRAGCRGRAVSSGCRERRERGVVRARRRRRRGRSPACRPRTRSGCAAPRCRGVAPRSASPGDDVARLVAVGVAVAVTMRDVQAVRGRDDVQRVDDDAAAELRVARGPGRCARRSRPATGGRRSRPAPPPTTRGVDRAHGGRRGAQPTQPGQPRPGTPRPAAAAPEAITPSSAG